MGFLTLEIVGLRSMQSIGNLMGDKEMNTVGYSEKPPSCFHNFIICSVMET